MNAPILHGEHGPVSLVVYEGSGEWSALYVDGKLNIVGDHYLIDERIREIVGASTVQTDDFLRGGQSRADVAKTLADVEKYAVERETRLEEAARLRSDLPAIVVLAQAEELAQ